MPRTIADHYDAGPVNSILEVVAGDETSAGGAAVHYQVLDVGRQNTAPDATDTLLDVHFQNGLTTDVGVNGVTNEVLLAIVVDRLRGFQAGPFACRENAIALTYLENGLMWLQRRARDRVARGVSDKHQK